MGHRMITIGTLVVLLVVGVTGVSARAADASSTLRTDIPHAQAFAQAIPLPNWEQANTSGFGDPAEQEVSALEAFNGYLYAGTYNVIDPLAVYDGARIFRSPDGLTWTPITQPGFQNPHDTTPPAILDFIVFGNRLYASTGRGGNPAQIWRSSASGLTWAPMVTAGFGDPEIHDIAALAVYNNMIYAGASSQVNGARLYRSTSGDSNTWTPVAPAASTMAGAGVTGFAVFNGVLYATVESQAPVQIWRSSGGVWTTVVNNGFGNSLTTATGGMAVFGGFLYVGAGNTASGAQLWRTSDGATWDQAITPGFGDPNNSTVESVHVFQNQLHVSVKNAVTGLEVWRSVDGTLWEQINQDGFGDSKNTTSNRNNATTDLLSQLYVGTSNIVDGCELWRTIQQLPDTPTATDTPTNTPTDMPTYTPTYTPTNTLTNTPTDTPTNTPTETPTTLSTYTPTATSTDTPTNTPTYTPTATSTDTPTNTPTYTPMDTSTATSTATPTDTPTNTATSTPTPTPVSSTPGKVTGGGTIGSEKDGNKATFGFTLNYRQGDSTPEGNLIYQDHQTDLRLKATSFELLVIDDTHAWFTGMGLTNTGQVVSFKIEIGDESGKLDHTDMFYIEISALNGYTAGGAMTGGNITIHK